LGGVSQGPLSSLNLGRSRNDEPDLVRENYHRFGDALGANLDRIVMCQQVHSDTVRIVTEADAFNDLYEPTRFEGDGLITNRPGLTLAVFYADCIPVLLYDPVCRVIAAIHSGWRGTSLGIAGKAVMQMSQSFGSRPDTILAAIGPGIGPRCFETHDDVPKAMVQTLGASISPFITPLLDQKYQVDLKGIIAYQLHSIGLLPEHISSSDLCTGCHLDLFWSHRKLGDQRGNQAAMIQLLPIS
jgi:YfiH family protein